MNQLKRGSCWRNIVAAWCAIGAVGVVAAQTGEGSMKPVNGFGEVSVHDPAVFKAGGKYYILGSHLAGAVSDDLVSWKLIDAGVKADSKIIPNVTAEMREALEWGQSRTFWAGVVRPMPDGKFNFYYCVCKGDSPRSALGLAMADQPEGPYKNVKVLLKSGMWGQASEDGTVYDATIHPNAVDPDVFADDNGNLWMIYGSYSGGIYVMRLDDKTGLPLQAQGYGTKVMGANHSRIEAPAMWYDRGTGYYYLFVSFGGLDSHGGYQVRVSRARAPQGPFVDARGKQMMDAHGAPQTIFDDKSIEPFGVKVVGNFQFVAENVVGEGLGYVSPGHNSVYVDESTGNAFIVMHSRFPGMGERHQVRVHRLMINADGWPVMLPQRYTGILEKPEISGGAIAGKYQMVLHGRRITAEITPSVAVELLADGTIRGGGTWRIDSSGAVMSVGGAEYRGFFTRQWDSVRQADVMTFSGVATGDGELGGTAMWLSGLPVK